MALTDLVGQLLPALDEAFPTNLVEVLSDFLTDHADADAVELLLADYELEQLVRVRADEPAASAHSVAVTGTAAGQAYVSQSVLAVPENDATAVYVPVSLRAERLGVLVVRIRSSLPSDVLEGLRQVATVVAYVVFGAGRFTDMYEQARRRKPLALDAEMQWNLLPVRAFAGPHFEIAGQLMPAYDVGGGCFDYSVESTGIHLTLTDGMGHGVQASLLDTLALSAIRNARRAGRSLVEQAHEAQAALTAQFGGVAFVAAFIARVESATGTVRVINAGHPHSWRVRRGQVQPVELRAQLPLGLFPDTDYVEQTFTLHPGDRLFLVSDGITDAAPRNGTPFGEDLLQGALLATATAPPHEAVRQTLAAAAAHQQGNFRDDATALCLDWHGSGQVTASTPPA